MPVSTAAPPMVPVPPMIRWYRIPVDREVLRHLHERSDLLAFLQTGGYLGLLAGTGTLAILSATREPWWVTVTLTFVHGMFFSFMINAFHELVHDSVFRTRALNRFFLKIVSFLGWQNPYWFWASHTDHHRYTLHPPADLEVVLPVKYTLKDFLAWGFIGVPGILWALKGTVRLARGRLEGEWENALFPPHKVEARRRLFRWAWILLVGHGLIVAVSLVMHWWMLPVVVTFANFYGGWLFYLHNNTQHVGLVDNVPDFRLCCRTILLNPFFQFLYWHMNYHTEHHMYASVPCYRLGALHRAIRHEMPECPRGLIATWRQIIGILRRQKTDPSYQYRPALPTPAR